MRQITLLLLSPCAFMVIVLQEPPVPAEGPPPHNASGAKRFTGTEEEIGRIAIEGIRNGRDKLRSASFRGSESIVRSTKSDGIPKKSRTEFDGGFDIARDRYRFHYRDEADLQAETFYTESPEGVTVYSPATKVVGKRKLNDRKPNPWQMVDMRSLGLCHAGELAITRYPEMIKFLSSLDKVRGKPNEDGSLIEIEIIQLEGKVRRSITVDVDKDYAPIRMEIRSKDDKSPDWSDPQFSAEVTWERHADVWVPVKAILLRDLGGRTETRSMTLEWLDINGISQ